MNFEIMIAQVAAIIYLSVAIGFLFNGKHYKDLIKDFFGNKGLLYLAGFITVIIGYIIIQKHNVWEYSWVVLVTLIGWAALIKGVLLLAFPDVMMAMSKPFMKKDVTITISIITLILGLVFGYYGFLA